MAAIEPTCDSELAQTLLDAAQAGHSIQLGNARLSREADVAVTTRRMTRILRYEPRDLTISVEAGMPYAALTDLLAKDGLMLPLDPPWRSLTGERRRSA